MQQKKLNRSIHVKFVYSVYKMTILILITSTHTTVWTTQREAKKNCLKTWTKAVDHLVCSACPPAVHSLQVFIQVQFSVLYLSQSFENNTWNEHSIKIKNLLEKYFSQLYNECLWKNWTWNVLFKGRVCSNKDKIT